MPSIAQTLGSKVSYSKALRAKARALRAKARVEAEATNRQPTLRLANHVRPHGPPTIAFLLIKPQLLTVCCNYKGKSLGLRPFNHKRGQLLHLFV